MPGLTRLLYIYASEDDPLRQALEYHLSSLEKEGIIEGRHLGLFLAGTEVSKELAAEVAKAGVVLLLLSADFMASGLCQSLLAHVQEQCAVRHLMLVPILARPVDWRGVGLGGCQPLPRNGQPVTLWPNQDAAWVDVAEGLRALLTGASINRSPQELAPANVSSHQTQHLGTLHIEGTGNTVIIRQEIRDTAYGKPSEVPAELGLSRPPNEKTDSAGKNIRHEPVEGRADRIFIGRSDEVAKLERLLIWASEPTKPVAVCSLQGMPGVGKSYLCDYFAQKHAAVFPGGYHRIVFSSELTPTAEEKLMELAEHLGLRGPEAELWEATRQRLRFPSSLLHIENVDSAALADVSARLVRRFQGCAVLISGRHQGLGRDAGWSEVSVKPLGEDESFALLIAEHREPSNADEERDFRELVDRLGGLPLAIHLCAGQLRRGINVKRFLASLEQTILDLKARPGDSLAETPQRTVLRASFTLSLEQLIIQFGADGKSITQALGGFGYAPPGGVGLSLAAALCGLPVDQCERLLVEAAGLSLLEPSSDPKRPDGVWRVHPLLAEFLRQRPQPKASSRVHLWGRRIAQFFKRDEGPEGGGFPGMTAWFLDRLPKLDSGQAAQQGRCWAEIHAEHDSLVNWLERVPPEQIGTVERVGSWFAKDCGPFAGWAALCERGLPVAPDETSRSSLLWTLSQVLLRAGELDRALAYAKENIEVCTQLQEPVTAAQSQGIIADIFELRGQLDEALDIRYEEQLPVYEKLGVIRERALTIGQIANILQKRGEFDEALRLYYEESLPVYEEIGDIQERATTLGRIAEILQMRGQLDKALRIRREEQLPVYEKLGAIRERALVMGQIADIMERRGELDDALRIRREEELPVYEKLGDIRERASTMVQIADILERRGELDAALRILREESLPVYEKLGDVRSRAVIMRKIAGVLQGRGQVDDALRILREEALAVYEKLGDVRERAMTMQQIADNLETRGQWEESLRIRREETLPVFKKLGDIRAHAVTAGRIADTLEERDQWDEALRIRREEELPVFEKLGDVRERAVTMGKIAHILQGHGEQDEALRIYREESLPVYEELADIREKALAMTNIADILQTRGEMDEALRIYRKEVLPIFKKLGEVRSLLVGRANLAAMLRKRNKPGDRQEAHSELTLALRDAQDLGLLRDEAKIKELLDAEVA